MVRHDGLEMGAYPGAEVLYVFQTASYFERGATVEWPTQPKLSDQMISYWTWFAASGHPDGTSPKWSPYRNAQDQVLSFAPWDIFSRARLVDAVGAWIAPLYVYG